MCEPLACKMDCPFGLKQDDKCCDICECRECKVGSDCPVNCPNPSCDPGGTCLCSGCEPVTCKMLCEKGWQKDDKGCDICVCAECQKDEDCPLGCPGAHCSAKKTCECGPTCLPVVCGLYCEHGFLKDADGCDICKCRECETEKDCAGVNCPDPKCAADGLCKCDCSGIPPKDYECPGGVKVPFCACGPLGYQCLPHPEYQCPTLCHPDGRVDFPCASGGAVPWCDCKPPASSCFPVCKEIGSYSEGWYDSCTGDKIAFAICDGCVPVCSAIGTKSEGWVDSCSGKLIRWDNCGMVDRKSVV